MTASPTPKNRPAFRWLAAAAWMLIALAYVAFFVIELGLDYNQLLAPCEGPDCNWAAITAAEFIVLEEWGLPARFYADALIGGMIVTAAVFTLLGGLIFWRRGATRTGFFFSLFLIVSPIASYVDAENVAANYPALALLAAVLSVVGGGSAFGMIYLFPNGKFYPRWAHVVLIITLVYVGTSLLATGNFVDLGPLHIFAFDWIGFFVLIVTAIVFQILRYLRNATLIEQLQMRWVIFGFVFYFLGPFFWFFLYSGVVSIASGAPRLIASMGGWILIQVSHLAFLYTIAVAILRYRLWNIDLIIRRTLVYGSLTGMLALLYFGTVVTLQGLFRQLAGETNSPLVTVISTLVIAGLFNPLRIRMQDFIDRRFYRRRYDAQRSVARFAVSARDEVDVNRLAVALLATVEETVQPDTANLWINLSSPRDTHLSGR